MDPLLLHSFSDTETTQSSHPLLQQQYTGALRFAIDPSRLDSQPQVGLWHPLCASSVTQAIHRLITQVTQPWQQAPSHGAMIHIWIRYRRAHSLIRMLRTQWIHLKTHSSPLYSCNCSRYTSIALHIPRAIRLLGLSPFKNMQWPRQHPHYMMDYSPDQPAHYKIESSRPLKLSWSLHQRDANLATLISESVCGFPRLAQSGSQRHPLSFHVRQREQFGSPGALRLIIHN